MKKQLIIYIIALALGILNAKVNITTINEHTLHVSWSVPEWQTSTQGEYTYLQATGLANAAIVGSPNIPFDECKVAIPPSGAISINITKQKYSDIHLEKRIQPVPEVTQGGKTDVYHYSINEELYSNPNPELIFSTPQQQFRQITFIPIHIFPFIYDGGSNLRVYTDIEFTVNITGNLIQKSNQPLDELSTLLVQQVINPIQAKQWQSHQRDLINYADFSNSNYWIKIDTDKDGMFKITPSQINMFPLNDIDPRTFRMFTTDGYVQPDDLSYAGPLFKEIPIYVSGENDGVFNSGDYILFYGHDRDGLDMNLNVGGNQYCNPYSKSVSYWLTFGSTASLNRINLESPQSNWNTSVTSVPDSIRIETETYQRRSIGFDWYMGKFFGNGNSEYQYTINLEDVNTEYPQTLSLSMIQEAINSDLMHSVRLKVNNNYLLNSTSNIQEWTWSGSIYPQQMSHTGYSFVNGSNNLGINVIRSRADNLFLDYYQVAYIKKLIKRSSQYTVSIPPNQYYLPVKYNFTGNNSNIRVFKTLVNSDNYSVTEVPISTTSDGFSFIGAGSSSVRFLVTQPSDYYSPASITSVTPTDLSNRSMSYDNIIVTPDLFAQQAQTLANLYNQKWHRQSKVVLLQDIFNQFNGGMPDPGAVRLFLKYCVENYQAPAITSVTLLGSGTCDWRNNSGISTAKNHMIVYQKWVSTSDDYFAMLNSNQFPELAIGRYPAKTVNELNIMLGNLENYLNNPQPGIWRNSLLFLADDEYNGQVVGEYEHSKQLQSTSMMIDKSILIDKIFAIDYNFDEFQNKPKARDDMFKGINEGKLIWYYIGHGSFDTLGAEDYFKGSLDMNRFNNPGNLPLFIAASCDVAQYDSFAFDCAAEKVLLADDRGAIASIAATRECNGDLNTSLMINYFNYSLNLRNPVGYSIVMAKMAFVEYSNNDEKYNLLGDPLLLVTTPERDSTITITSAKNGSFNSRELVTFRGEFSQSGISDTTAIQVFDNSTTKMMPGNYPYTFRGKSLYKGTATVSNSQYNAGFIVPDDVSNGNTGLVLAYIWDSNTKRDYVNYLPDVAYSDQQAVVDSIDIPEIKLYLNDAEFVDGDIVGANPVLMAKVSDQNGINVTNSPGHGMLLILDQTVSTTNVTDYFTYNKDSYTDGTIQYELTGLSDGHHIAQLIVFDNLNQPSVATISFVVSKDNALSIKDFMPYPNPMKKNGYFTFIVSEPANVRLSIYTVRGKKIKTISTSAVKGYNQVLWDGKDSDGDYIANNTYFVKLTAKSQSGKAKVEKIEKLVIYR